MTSKKTSLRRCIEELSAKNTDYKFPEQAINQAESLKSLSSDLYTDNIRFIYELIQNADDAEAKNIVLTICEDKYLIIAHNGKPFDDKDLQGLCGVNNGTKKKDLDKTGYKGLGFKAVFGKSDRVIIYSNGEYFRFDSSFKINWNKQWGTVNQKSWEEENDRQFIYPWQINPVWTNQNDIPTSISEFLNLRKAEILVANIILLNHVEEIRLAVDQLKQQPYMFLFLRNIFQMTFVAQTTDTISIARDLNYGLKKVYFNQKVVSQWIIKRFELDVPNEVREKLCKDSKVPDKLRSIKKAEIFFAAKYKDPIIDQDGIVTNPGGIEKLRDQESILFSYLPTKILEYKFPILVNANFLTNVNREQIHTDSVWNQWLFEKVGNEIIQWIRELVIDEKFSHQAYRLIPMRLNPANTILSKRFNESFETAVKHCDFILNRENQLLRVDETIMDLTSLSEQPSFINIDSMRKYIINYYKNTSFQCANQPFIDYDSNLHRVGVRQFTWHNSIEMFKSDIFLETHTIEQNIRMIEYFYTKYSEPGIHIEQIPFLMDENNRLQLAKDIYFPAETMISNRRNDSNDLYVHTLIFDWLNDFAPKEIREWLEKLGVTERNDLTYLHKTIIPNASTFITLGNAIKTIKMLFMLFEKNLILKKEFDQLKKLKLLTICGTLVSADQCFFSDQFNPRLKLEEYLGEIEVNFLSFNYLKNNGYRRENQDLAEWRRFFSMLGVQEELSVIEYAQKLTIREAHQQGFNREYLKRRSPNGLHFVDAYSGLKTITFLQQTENDYEFSKFFWAYVLKNIKAEKFTKNIKVYWGYSDKRGAITGTPIDDDSYVKWFVENIKCIPTTLNTCDVSSNIFIETKELKLLCDKYMPFALIPLPQDKTSWNRVFNFKTKLSIDDYFNLLENIRHDEKDLKNNHQRIQSIFFQILKEIHLWSSDERRNIRKRASQIYFLTENYEWKLANTLHIYIDNTGTNSNLNDTIPCLKLDFNNKNHVNLQKFLDLFSIKRFNTNDFKLVDENSSPAKEFRNKLIEISPFLQKWLQHSDLSKDIVTSIDKIIQENTHFIESDCLKLFYNEKFVRKTRVYHDIARQQFYITRPWKNETTLLHLPNKLCQLLNIEKFEHNLGFLLRVEKEEIIEKFKEDSIEIPTHKDIVNLKLLPKTETTQKDALPKISLPLSNESASSINDQKISSTSKQINEPQTIQPENRKSIVSSLTDTKCLSKSALLRHRQDSFHEPIDVIGTTTNKLIRSLSIIATEPHDEQLDHMEVIDISSLTTLKPTLIKNPLGRIGGHDDLDLVTGIFGERIVYDYLLNKYRQQSNSVYIKWENENGESHLPYDILLTKNGKQHYIEVKSTRTSNQHSFRLSLNEIEHILQHKENYFIYRVYIQENKLMIFDNIRQRLHKQQMACFITFKPLSFDENSSSDDD